jgi:hypothetical protein
MHRTVQTNCETEVDGVPATEGALEPNEHWASGRTHSPSEQPFVVGEGQDTLIWTSKVSFFGPPKPQYPLSSTNIVIGVLLWMVPSLGLMNVIPFSALIQSANSQRNANEGRPSLRVGAVPIKTRLAVGTNTAPLLLKTEMVTFNIVSTAGLQTVLSGSSRSTAIDVLACLVEVDGITEICPPVNERIGSWFGLNVTKKVEDLALVVGTMILETVEKLVIAPPPSTSCASIVNTADSSGSRSTVAVKTRLVYWLVDMQDGFKLETHDTTLTPVLGMTTLGNTISTVVSTALGPLLEMLTVNV